MTILDGGGQLCGMKTGHDHPNRDIEVAGEVQGTVGTMKPGSLAGADPPVVLDCRRLRAGRLLSLKAYEESRRI
jgi:hypothetical protein